MDTSSPPGQNGTVHPFRTATMEVHDSNSSPPPNYHCTRAGSLQNNGNVRSPSCSMPPPLPLSLRMSYLSMKECQAFSPSDWQFLLFRFSGCFKRVVTRKTTLLGRLFSRLPPLVSHLPVSIMYKEIYD